MGCGEKRQTCICKVWKNSLKTWAWWTESFRSRSSSFQFYGRPVSGVGARSNIGIGRLQIVVGVLGDPRPGSFPAGPGQSVVACFLKSGKNIFQAGTVNAEETDRGARKKRADPLGALIKQWTMNYACICISSGYDNSQGYNCTVDSNRLNKKSISELSRNLIF